MNKNLELFIDFLKSTKKNPCDLEYLPTSDEWLKPLLGNNASKFFKIYFRNKGGDLIGEWDINGKFEEGVSLPFVWLSSEGTPNTIVAKDQNEFFSLLPYGQGIITGIPGLIEKHKRKPTIVVAPDKKYNIDAIKSAYEYQASMFDGHIDMVNFITKNLGIPVNHSPLDTIKKTLEQYPNLDNWIEENL